MRYRDMAKPRFPKGTSREIRRTVARVIAELERESGHTFRVTGLEDSGPLLTRRLRLVAGGAVMLVSWAPGEVQVDLVEAAA